MNSAVKNELRPESIGALNTLNDVVRVMRSYDLPNAALRRTPSGWESISSKQMYDWIVAFASVLRSYGIGKGDRVAIIAENRVEWAITDFACLGLGAVDVPIYPTLTAEQIVFILRNCSARVA